MDRGFFVGKNILERMLNMPVRISVTDENLTAYLSGEIDHHSAKPIREEIDEAAERGRPQDMVLDFRDVSFMDSSGIGLVMGRYALMQELGGRLHTANTSPHITKVMKLAGLERLSLIQSKGGKNK
jgi:stage II sporulation protein AA (anti-sigma F factor antagonist)